MAQEPKYEERYCAYVDILAFKALVAELRAVPSRLETIRTLLKKFAIRTMNVISVSEIQTFAYKASQTPLLFPYDQPLKDFRFYALHCENSRWPCCMKAILPAALCAEACSTTMRAWCSGKR